MSDLAERITIDPEQCGGRPCIRSLRIRVSDVLDLLANGLTPEQVLEEVLDLEMLTSESTSCWSGLVQGLVDRGLRPPRLVVIDGNKGLRAAVEQSWPEGTVLRCTVHKLRNLERYVPRHALEEERTDYHKIIRAESLDDSKKAYREFISK